MVQSKIFLLFPFSFKFISFAVVESNRHSLFFFCFVIDLISKVEETVEGELFFFCRKIYKRVNFNPKNSVEAMEESEWFLFHFKISN